MTLSTRYLAAIVLAIPSVAAAQMQPTARVGNRVRITAPQTGYETIIGQLIAADNQQLTISASRSQPMYYVPRSQIQAIDISVERKRQTRSGVIVGALNGSLFGLGVSLKRKTDPNNDAETVPLISTGKGMMLGAAGGAVIGGIAGYLVRKDRWVNGRTPD